MKVKGSVAKPISNKKKNALPSSKLLKPKKFKPTVKKSGEGIVQSFGKSKLKLINDNIKENLGFNSSEKLEGKSPNSPRPTKTLKKVLGKKEKAHSNSPTKTNNSNIDFQETNISTLFDFVTTQDKAKYNVEECINSSSTENKNSIVQQFKAKPKQISKTVAKRCHDNECETGVRNPRRKEKKLKRSFNGVESSPQENIRKQNNNGKYFKKSSDVNGKSNKSPGKKIKGEEQNKPDNTNLFNKCKLTTNKVNPVTKALLSLTNKSSSSQPEILDVGEPIFMQVECIKIPICPTKQLRFKLPHPIVDETSDVLLMTSDLKGHKIYPDKAIEHYEELLAKHGIDFINKVMPLRMAKREYSQYEMRRKLVDQFDVILADSRIIRSLPSVLGKFALYNRKMPIPVNLTIGEHKLKKHLRDAVSKTQMTVKSNGVCSVVQVGHSKMDAKEVAANIVEVAKSLETVFPGGWRNIRSLMIKTVQSTALPVYLSLLSPNEVETPVEVRREPAPVVGELSTKPGYHVVVSADGNVELKKIEEEMKIDDTRDMEILEEAEKYRESTKTVRYDESSDEEKEESDSEGEAITDAMEKKLMSKYEKNAKKKKDKPEDDEEEEDDDEEEDEEESVIVPVAGKKRKSLGSKKQSGPPAKKKSVPVEKKGKNKAVKSTKEGKTPASPGIKKPQGRGTRGGKKNKLSKDQRKALIKRKKAGKK